MNDDLASGFKDVDRAADFTVFSSCLDLIEKIPFFADCKRESYGLLNAVPGRRIVDVGCGLGEDAAALARLVALGGAVVGVDGSQAMIEAARRRHSGVEGLSFEVADAADLPFDDGSFDACRIDRVLQHIAEPGPVVRELARVLRPGGILVAFDNDWETLAVDSADRVLTRTVLNSWCDRFPSGWIGRRLVRLFQQAGFRDIVAFPKTLVLRELEVADRLYCFIATVERLADAGIVSRDDARRWSAELRAADDEGRFFSSYTGFLVRGTRLAPVGEGLAQPHK
jgi:ubiquinone/menaquinone biosynthesis C-methylase UbiE